METSPFYECSVCSRRLKEGEFVAIVGKTPPTGMSMPLGRADAIFKKVDRIYCDQCFKNSM